MRKKTEQMRPYSIRVDKEEMELAAFYKIDTAALFRKALREEIAKREGQCPHCGSKAKWKPL